MFYLILNDTKNDIAEVNLIYSIPPLVSAFKEIIVVEKLPDIEESDKRPILCYNKNTKKLFNKYVEKIEDKHNLSVNKLQEQIINIQENTSKSIAELTALTSIIISTQHKKR